MKAIQFDSIRVWVSERVKGKPEMVIANFDKYLSAHTLIQSHSNYIGVHIVWWMFYILCYSNFERAGIKTNRKKHVNEYNKNERINVNKPF